MTTPLFTIGYEGKTQAELIDQLVAAHVATVIDVRALASSRRPGFSKTGLREALREAGIGYTHLRALGTPKDGREAARRGRTAEMRDIYAGQLATPEAELAMAQTEAAARESSVALLCFEREACHCHRAMIAERLIDAGGFAVVDL